MEKFSNSYLDKRKWITKFTSFKFGDVSGEVMSKDNFSQEQITKLNNFSAKIIRILILK